MTELANEFFIGIISTPVKYLELHFAFALFNEAVIMNDMTIEKGSSILDIGLKVGACFNCDWFNLEFNYVPRSIYIFG